MRAAKDTFSATVSGGGGPSRASRPTLRQAAGGLLIAVALAACSVGRSPEQPKVGEDLVLGAPMSLTGNQSKEGALTKVGYDIWRDRVNAHGGITVTARIGRKGVRHRVQIRYLDDRSTPEVSGQVAQQLIAEDGARFLLGSYGSSDTAADAAVAEKNHMPLVASNGAARSIYTRGYRYVFGVQSSAESELQGVLDMAATMNPRPTRIALLSADDSFSVEVAGAAVDYAPRLGMQVVYNYQYPSGSTNLYAALDAAKTKKPDIILNSGHLIEAIAITKAARDVRLDAAIFAYTSGPATRTSQALGKDANYVYSGSQWSPQLQYKQPYSLLAAQFAAEYQKKAGTNANPRVPGRERHRSRAGAAKGDRACGQPGPRESSQRPCVTRPGHILRPHQVRRTRPERLQDGGHRADSGRQAGNGLAATLATSPPMYPTPAWSTRTTIPVPTQPAPKAPVVGLPPD